MSEHDSTCAPVSKLPRNRGHKEGYSNWETFYLGVELCDLARKPAVYVVIGDGVVQYVGSSRNLRTRMAGRMPEYRYDEASSEYFVLTQWGTFTRFQFKVSYSQRYGDWLMRELRLIRRLRPVHNIETDGGQRPYVVLRGRRRSR